MARMDTAAEQWRATQPRLWRVTRPAPGCHTPYSPAKRAHYAHYATLATPRSPHRVSPWYLSGGDVCHPGVEGGG